MQKYPKGIVLPLEKAGLSWSFETRRGGTYGKKTIVCHIVDRETGRRILEASGPDELSALKAGAEQASGIPKAPTDKEMARTIAEQNAKIEALNNKIAEAEKSQRSAGKTAPKAKAADAATSDT